MPLQLSPLAPNQLSTAVARVVASGVQGPAKMMAARGLVPMGPRDLLTVLYQLSFDADPKIAETSKQTAAGLPDNIIGAAIGEAIDPRVLHYYAELVLDRPALLEKLLLNRATHDETYIHLAGKLDERELELLAGNQERLLACPAIIESIYFNKQARMSTVERLLEMAVRNGISLDKIPAFKEISSNILGGFVKHRDHAELVAMDVAFAADVADEGIVGDMEIGDEQQADKQKRERSFLVKLRLAAVGSPGKRMELIRDTNRSVAMAAISSPAVTDQEAIRYASNRALNEEVIRYIASRKDWQKNYAFKVALVNNPKCPLPTAMHLLPHLRAGDLRALTRSKNVPSALAQAAKEHMRKKSG